MNEPPSPHQARIENIFDVTPLQAGMLFHKLLDVNSSQYVLQETVRISGPFDRVSARTAFDLLGRRHDAVRMAVVVPTTSGVPRLVVLTGRSIAQAEVDLRGRDDPEAALAQLADEELARGFDLTHDPLMRVVVARLAEAEFALVWSMHHIVVDGWSLPILSADFMRYYGAVASGLPIAEILTGIDRECQESVSFGGYATWLAAQPQDGALDYWAGVLDGYDAAVGIAPLGMGDPAASEVAVLGAELAGDDLAALTRAGVEHGITLSTWVEAAWGLVLARHNRTADVVFGHVDSGRSASLPGIESMVGLTINTTPVRVRPRREAPVLEFLGDLRDQSLASAAHSRVPLVDVLHRSGLDSDAVQTLVAFENYHVGAGADAAIPGLSMRVEALREQTSYPLSLRVGVAETMVLETLYDPRVYSEEEVRLVLDRVVTAVMAMANGLDRTLDEIDVLPRAEREIVLADFAATPGFVPDQATMGETLEHWARMRPDHPAVVMGPARATFGELDRRANRLGNDLRSMGVGPGDFVIVAHSRGIEAYVAQYGIAKAGGAWVPIDSSYPAERFRAVVHDCAPKAIVTCGFPIPDGIDVPVIDIAGARYLDGDDAGPPPSATGSDVAYCIFTSGTTGRPKGVVVEHRQLMNAVAHLQHVHRPRREDIVAQFFRLTFDASLWEHGLSILSGRTACIVPEDVILQPQQFHDYLEEHRVSIALLPPTFALSAHLPSALRVISTGGAASNAEVVRKITAQSAYVNSYGPTECTVWGVEWHCGPGEPVPQAIPIGRPIGNVTAYVLDGTRLMGIGMPGELCLGGACVARGYLNRPELTDEKFIDNPFGQGRLYRTGDLAQWLPDGNLAYLGRCDDQIKIRGFRIEPAEIEALIREVNGVADAVVLARPMATGEASLWGFYSESRVGAVAPRDISAHLAVHLPDYMVPAGMTAVPEFPVTRAGKVDHSALLQYASPVAGTGTGAPRTDIERKLADVFREVLGVPEIGVADDFFDLGGDSLKAIRIVSLLGGEGIDVSVRDLFTTRTVEKAALLVEAGAAPAPRTASDVAGPPSADSDGSGDPAGKESFDLDEDSLVADVLAAMDSYAAAIVAQPSERSVGLTAAQQCTARLGLLASYAVIQIDGVWDYRRFRAAWRDTVAEFDILATTVDLGEGLMRYHPVDGIGTPPWVDLTPFTSDTVDSVLGRILHASPYGAEETYDGRQLSHRIVSLVRQGGFVVVLPLSHLIFDALSNDVLAARLRAAYEGRIADTKAPDYASFADFIGRGPELAVDHEIASGLGLWEFAHLSSELAGRCVGPLVPVMGFVADTGTDVDDEGRLFLAEALLEEGLAHSFGRSDIPVLMVHAGRNYRGANYSSAVGEFLDLVPAVLGASRPGVVSQLSRQASFLRQNDLSVMELMCNPALADRYPRSSGALRAIQLGEPIVPIVNLLALQRESLFILPQEQDDTTKISPVLTSIIITDRSVVVQAMPCLKGREDGLIEHLNWVVGRFKESYSCPGASREPGG